MPQCQCPTNTFTPMSITAIKVPNPDKLSRLDQSSSRAPYNPPNVLTLYEYVGLDTLSACACTRRSFLLCLCVLHPYAGANRVHPVCPCLIRLLHVVRDDSRTPCPPHRDQTATRAFLTGCARFPYPVSLPDGLLYGCSSCLFCARLGYGSRGCGFAYSQS